MVCAFTGHRPDKLPWGTDDRDPHCQALQHKLQQAVAALVDEGYDTFLCGMARGCDRYFFEAVQRQRRATPAIRLIAVVPCASQANAWPAPERARYQAALAACDDVWLLSEHYYPGCMQMRNRHMVARADLLLTVWDGSPGGTGSTIACARREGVPVRGLWR